MMKLSFSSWKFPFGTTTPAPPAPSQQGAVKASEAPATSVATPRTASPTSPRNASQAVGIPAKPSSRPGSPACSPSPSAAISIPEANKRRSTTDGKSDAFNLTASKDFSKDLRGSNRREAVPLLTNAFTVMRTNPPEVTTNFGPLPPPQQPLGSGVGSSDSDEETDLDGSMSPRPARAASAGNPSLPAKELTSSSSSIGSGELLHQSGSDPSDGYLADSCSEPSSRHRASSGADIVPFITRSLPLSTSDPTDEEAVLRRIHSEADMSGYDPTRPGTPGMVATKSEPPASPVLVKIKPQPVNNEKFEKIKLIGRGDVGKVYLVRHRDTKELYAMKVLDKATMIRRNKIKRVLTERDILATADHPFIVTLHWSFQSAEKLYLVMDYCAGGGLFRIIQQQPGKCLPEDSARFYAAEVLLALEYLHVMGFIYRDLKSENVLLHDSGHIMLTDFDLSKVAVRHSEAQLLRASVTAGKHAKPDVYSVPELGSNSFVGTAEYLAPEIIRGYHQSCSVDWWTYGILLYEMLYGFTPFQAKTTEDTFAAILDGGLYFPENHIYAVSADAKNLIRRLLHPDPKRRLGGEHDAVDIKKHKFFDRINFVLIRNMTPPLVPKVKKPDDTSYFRNLKDEEQESDTDSELSEEEQMTGPFKDFKQVFKETRVKRTYDKDQLRPPLGGPTFGHRRTVSTGDVQELSLAKKESERNRFEAQRAAAGQSERTLWGMRSGN